MRTVEMATHSNRRKIKGSEFICANRWLAVVPSMAEEEAAPLASWGVGASLGLFSVQGVKFPGATPGY